MQTRQLGSSQLQLTTIGIGTWAIGGGDWKFGWGPQDEGDAIGAILRGVELGINWIDTAVVYGGGRSEELVGKALKELGSARRPLVATKCSRIIQSDGNITSSLQRDSVIQECEASLRRLGVDTIDLYQMHWPEPDEDIEEGWSAMVQLLNEGKVRYLGVSNFSVAQLRRLAPIHPITSLQPPYSMLAQGVEDELLDYCAEHSIGVVCYSPMCKGLLTGKFTASRAAELGDDDHRSRDPKFQDPQLSMNLELVEGLQPIAERNGRTVAQLAIAWVLRRSEVTSAIVGARRPDQIEQTSAAADWRLSADDLSEIDTLLSARQGAFDDLGITNTGRV